MKFLQIVYINIAQMNTKYFSFLTLPLFCGQTSPFILRRQHQIRDPAGESLSPESLHGKR